MLLDNFAQTLEESQCVAWYTSQDALIPAQVYPNMRKLSIELHHFPIRIDAFIHAFPNLTELRVLTEYHGGNVGAFSLEAMHESHATNIARQCAVDSCGTWMRLKHFYGCLFDLYAISLTSHIRRVAIMDRLDDGPRTEMLATVLRYARPLHLKLGGIVGAMLGDADRGFLSMLRDESASKLTSLDMRIYLGEGDRERALGTIIVRSRFRKPARCTELLTFPPTGQTGLGTNQSASQVSRAEVWYVPSQSNPVRTKRLRPYPLSTKGAMGTACTRPSSPHSSRTVLEGPGYGPARESLLA